MKIRPPWQLALSVAALVAALLLLAFNAKPIESKPWGSTPTPTYTEIVIAPVPGPTVTVTARADRASRGEPRVALGPTEAQWQALRDCEAGDDPTVVSSNGLYHGLYQFDVSTWRGVGGTGLPSRASRAEQHKRALLLYADRGAQPWPVCGKFLR